MEGEDRVKTDMLTTNAGQFGSPGANYGADDKNVKECSGCVCCTGQASALKEIMDLLVLEQSKSSERETRIMRELQLVSRRLREVQEQISDVRTAIPSPAQASQAARSKSAGTGLSMPYAASSTVTHVPTVPRTYKDAAATMSRTMSSAMHPAKRVKATPGVAVRQAVDVSSHLHRDAEVRNEDVHLSSRKTLQEQERTRPVGANTQQPVGYSADSLKTNLSTSITSTSKVLDEVALDDSTWTLVSSSKNRPVKKADLYVGNLKEGTTSDDLQQFLQSRVSSAGLSITIHRVTVAVSGSSNHTYGRLTVSATDAPLLKERNFWPGNLYCRGWQFRENDMSTSQAAETIRPEKVPDNRLKISPLPASLARKVAEQERDGWQSLATIRSQRPASDYRASSNGPPETSSETPMCQKKVGKRDRVTPLSECERHAPMSTDDQDSDDSYDYQSRDDDDNDNDDACSEANANDGSGEDKTRDSRCKND